jgi:hypothetical protein
MCSSAWHKHEKRGGLPREGGNQQPKKPTDTPNTAHRNPLGQSCCSHISDLVVVQPQHLERLVFLIRQKTKIKLGYRESAVTHKKNEKD